MPIIIENLSHTYMQGTTYETKALDSINLEINDGEIFAIIGQTGSGKSTLIQHFNGILKPDVGKVFVNGQEMSKPKLARKSLIKKVGLVFQYPEYQLFAETVFDDIAFGPRNLGLTEGEVIVRVNQTAKLLGLDLDKLGKNSPFELSGGEKRKVALCGVIAIQPEVLVLDEPTAGLDYRGKLNLHALINKLNKEEGYTIVLVSHSMEDVASLADRIAIIDKGKIIKVGTPKEIYSDPEYLERIGLDVPPVKKLVVELKNRGIDMPDDILTCDEIGKHLIERIKK